MKNWSKRAETMAVLATPNLQPWLRDVLRTALASQIEYTVEGGPTIRFMGSPKQCKWAADILAAANLTAEQVDSLLRWAGPTIHALDIVDAIIIIDNRHNLARYATALIAHRNLSPAERQAVAQDAAAAVRAIARMACR